MDDLLAMYGGSIQSLKRGDKVKGKVVSISPKRVVFDIGGKSEGVVAEKAFSEAKDYIKNLEVGDEVTTSVIIPETYDGVTILSLREAAQDASWEKINAAQKKNAPVIVVGRSMNSSGVVVDLEGLVGFIPTSQIGKEASKNPASLINKHFKAKVIEADRNDNKIVLSEREVSDAEDIGLAKEAMEKLEEGKIYEGEVTTLASFGCFVRLDVAVSGKKKASVEGLVHISELSWNKVASAKSVVSEGDKVKVKVLSTKDDKLALSIKQAQDDPWEEVAKKYKKDTKVKGKVSKITDFGLFVELEEGVEGLIHLTKIPPGEKYEARDSVNVYVEEVDVAARKISLGIVLTQKPVIYR